MVEISYPCIKFYTRGSTEWLHLFAQKHQSFEGKVRLYRLDGFRDTVDQIGQTAGGDYLRVGTHFFFHSADHAVHQCGLSEYNSRFNLINYIEKKY